MKATQVDARYATELENIPRYRVDFWDASQASDGRRIEDALDMREVRSWCERHRNGRDYVLYVEYQTVTISV